MLVDHPRLNGLAEHGARREPLNTVVARAVILAYQGAADGVVPELVTKVRTCDHFFPFPYMRSMRSASLTNSFSARGSNVVRSFLVLFVIFMIPLLSGRMNGCRVVLLAYVAPRPCGLLTAAHVAFGVHVVVVQMQDRVQYG